MNKDQHVVPHQVKWAVKGGGNKKNTLITDTQQQAIRKAREIAKNQKSELLIHGRDGAIREKNSYGNDSENVKG